MPVSPLLAACAAGQVCCGGPSKPPCDQAKLAAIVAVCTEQSQACKSAGKGEAECSTLVDCDQQIDRACGVTP